jgi:Zn-dependent peptidase ImmA (M78 family)
VNDPFQIADAIGISIFYEELGCIKGYYNKPYRNKQIHINCNLSKHDARLTCAHELGHAVIHPNENTSFLRTNTFFSIEKMEIEANTFAIALLVPDEVLMEHCQYSYEQLSRLLGYEQQLIELRLKLLRKDNKK